MSVSRFPLLLTSADACMCEPRMFDKDSNPGLPGRMVGHQYIWQISRRSSNKTRA